MILDMLMHTFHKMRGEVVVDAYHREHGVGLSVGDYVECTESSPCGTVNCGQHYVVAHVSNGDRHSFIALEGMPARYFRSSRFEHAP